MSTMHTCEAIVLRTYDVGEADRFCILFTKEYGRLAARVSGVRRPLSRRGTGVLLPFHRVSLELSEGKTGYTILRAALIHRPFGLTTTSHAFTTASSIVELILKLTQDHLPLPGAYEAVSCALAACGSASAQEAFLQLCALKILSLLGHLPTPSRSVVSGNKLSPLACAYSSLHTGFCLSSEDAASILFPPTFLAVLEQLHALPIPVLARQLCGNEEYARHLLTSILSDHLGLTLLSGITAPTGLRSTPTCMVAGRAS